MSKGSTDNVSTMYGMIDHVLYHYLLLVVVWNSEGIDPLIVICIQTFNYMYHSAARVLNV